MAAKNVTVTLTIDPTVRGAPPPLKDIIVDGVKYRVVAIREPTQAPGRPGLTLPGDPTRHHAVSFRPVGACPACGK
jgi:hypothetical protein